MKNRKKINHKPAREGFFARRGSVDVQGCDERGFQPWLRKTTFGEGGNKLGALG
jgi:hypothetical protein